ncbi:MAG TPA: TIR domain-containing protein, partial [Chthoniobacter sp.]|nr:TIR domain-containing protein [Chthoniobacter sp.]
MATRGPDTRMEPAGSSAIYDAFISYKHGGDKPVASGLQQVLQTLGKSWWRRRTMRVFRDDTTLIPSPALARSIESALSQSRNLILIASPEAAASPWVEKEVAYWLEHRDVERLFIAVTAGDLTWNDAIGDFDWRPDTPLPPILRGRFKHEPLWVDLRPYRGAKGRIGKDDQEFVSRVAGIAAAILGRAKEDLLSEELRQQRRNFAWASGAAAGLAVLAATSIWLAVEAEQQRQAAVAQELEAHRNNTRAQMQLALVNGERSATREALVAALEGVDAARTGGIDLATLEPALYEISAKIPNGLVAAAQVTWPTAAANYLTRSIQFRGRDAVVCMHREQLGGEGKPTKGSEYCVGFGDGKLKLLPGETLGANLVQTEALYLEINKSKTDLNLSIEDFSGNPARPFRTIPSQPFGDHLDSSSFSGKVCPDLKRAVLSVTRWTPEKSGETKDVIGADNYVVTFDTLKVKRIYDDFGIDSVACSPDGRFIAGAPDRGNLAILDIEQDYIAATAAGDLARAAANAPGVAFSDNLALLPSMTQIRGTATRASLKLLA